MLTVLHTIKVLDLINFAVLSKFFIRHSQPPRSFELVLENNTELVAQRATFSVDFEYGTKFYDLASTGTKWLKGSISMLRKTARFCQHRIR